MAWTWRFRTDDEGGLEPAVDPEDFSTQEDAELWIGEHAQELLDGGADRAALLNDGAEIYEMSLHG
jgi:hypothetical protein